MSASPFSEYEVPGVGTVIAPEGEPGYRVRTPDGRVIGFAAASGNPCEANAAADIAHALANPPPPSAEAVWAQKLAGVIVDPVTSIPLKASIATRDILTATLVFLREAETAGAITESTYQTIWDADNVPHEMTVADLRGLLLRYGAAWQAMHAEFAP